MCFSAKKEKEKKKGQKSFMGLYCLNRIRLRALCGDEVSYFTFLNSVGINSRNKLLFFPFGDVILCHSYESILLFETV